MSRRGEIEPRVGHGKVLTKSILPEQRPALHVIADGPNGNVVQFTGREAGEGHFPVDVVHHLLLRRVPRVADPEPIQIELGGLNRGPRVSQGQRVRLILIDHHNHFRLDQRH